MCCTETSSCFSWYDLQGIALVRQTGSYYDKCTHLQINLFCTGDPRESVVYDAVQLNKLHRFLLMFHVVRKLLTRLLKTLRQPTAGFALLEARQLGASGQ
ncbi:hypothetical protein CSKR_109420 [Clonorchis sinensis]|uniref:Uncharacterized protein n=1 Tax=Clonorchis sinensis TaxID=79923 RepID=A0A419PYD5_CLOSI|nr:hypothetical protein CSKR_109420 [Clonorchis sinensis]